MGKFTKFLCLLIITFAVQLIITSETTSAKTNEKVYKTYSLYADKSKFPIKLGNSLVIDLKGEIEGPRILKGNRAVWEHVGGFMSGDISFTVTKNNDTYLYYKFGSGGEEMVEVVGVDKNGKVFMKRTFGGEHASMRAQFLSSSTIEIGVEKYSRYYDGTTASKHTGEFKSKFYQLYINGSVKELAYFDKSFVDLVKQGRLKAVPGSLGMPYSKLKTALNDPWATQEIAEVYNFYHSEKGHYGFYHNSNRSTKIKPNAQVRGIFRNSELYGTRKELRPFLRKNFGKEILNNSTYLDVYKVGKYYLAVEYSENSTVHINLNTQKIYY
ncbi:hypothetical protein CSV77_05745 [Sporosarcina sp. P16b]|uniref:hypothetical protein n=1 Tax=Sporosarcina sp. P16b TaxID=2048261 RepID=UPI000C172C52|nr:hypothetical protein [Sporosarcina sp. P16b]PIC70813.1 hypothetical protein CSV77_05745 [Sporosarcina sp. P16b]